MFIHCTAEGLAKLLPVTVSVKLGPPAVALAGEREEMDGVGIGAGAGVEGKIGPFIESGPDLQPAKRATASSKPHHSPRCEFMSFAFFLLFVSL